MQPTDDSIRVLHVDDEIDLVEMVATFLERENDRFDVEIAIDTDEGLDRLAEADFDCVVSDYNMPRRNGIEFLEAVREEYPDLPFILYTGKGSEEIASEAISAGVTDYLQKEGGTSQYTVLANRIRNAVDRYHTHERLADREERLGLFFDHSPMGIVEWDENFEFVRLNDTAEGILGYSEAELVGESWEKIVPDADRERVNAVVSKLLAAEGGYTSTNENVRKDGERIVCEWHNRVVTGDDDAVTAIFSHFRDVTDRRRQERRFEAIFNNTHTFVGLMEPDGTLIEANETALSFGGLDLEDVVGESLWETDWARSSADARATIKEGIERAREGELFRDEIRIRGADREAVIDFSVRPITDERGEVTLLVPEGRDITERKKQERKRQQIIDRVTDAIVEVDADWRFTLVNEQAEQLYDMAEEELLGRDFWEVFHEAEDTRFEEEYRRVMRTREPTSFVEYFSQLEGWFDVSAYPKENGGIAFYFVEVTERRERERELEQANTLLSTLFEALPVGVLAEGADRNVLAATDRTFELFDLPGSPAKARGKDCERLAEEVSDLFVDPEGFLERIDELVTARTPTDNEELSLTDGRTFERSYRPIELPDGDGHLWIYRDVTERTRFEGKITALHAAAQDIFQATTQRRVAEIVVEAVRDVLGMPINSVAIHDETENALRTIARTEQTYDLLEEEPVFRPDESLAWEAFETGTVKHYDDVSTVPGRHSADTPIRSEIIVPLGDHGVVLIGSTEAGVFDDVDISLAKTLGTHAETALDRIAHERELKEQNDRLEEFTSVVSHDLRNPLNVAQSRLELAQDECTSEHLDSVGAALERCEALIEDLLALAREGDRVSDTEAVDLASVTESCWHNVATARATIAVETDRQIRADRSRLQQLLENFYRNAIEHGGEDVTVTVGDLPGGFYVEDDGPGVPADERDRIFEAGYSTAGGETGFGLSIVKRIADAHGWEVRLTGGSEGGARFEITGVEFTDE